MIIVEFNLVSRTCWDGDGDIEISFDNRDVATWLGTCAIPLSNEGRPWIWMNSWLCTWHLECSTPHKKALRTFETSRTEWPTTQSHISEDLRLLQPHYKNLKSASFAHVEPMKNWVSFRNELWTASLYTEMWMFRELCDGFHQVRCRP
jgi:hypothetical protein